MISWAEALAEHGDQDAQFAVAEHYDWPLPRDTALAVHWYQKAAEQGQRDAQFRLGMLLATGDGLSKDTRQAAVWMEKAAEQNLECAMDALGKMYADEHSGITDMVKAAKWWQRLSDVAATFQLSWCYALGEGVEGDTDIAWDLLLEATPKLARDAERLFKRESWWKAKAYGGNRNALYWLGECYNQFATHRTDLCRAYKQEAFTCFKRAAELGQAEAQDAIRHIQCDGNAGNPQNTQNGMAVPRVDPFESDNSATTITDNPMNVKPIEIQIRPTYESLCTEWGIDPIELGDPDKTDPVAFEQGARTVLLTVESGESFEITRGFEGFIDETDHFVRIIDPTRSSPDNDESTDAWGLTPGRYLYDGRDVKVVQRFSDDEYDALDDLPQV